MTSALERRVEALEVAVGGGGGGCERCRGTLVVVKNAISGMLERARWNGDGTSREELHERQTERECPRCGRRVDSTEGLELGSVGSGDESTH